VAAAFIAFDMYDAAQNGIIGHTHGFSLFRVMFGGEAVTPR